jgi:hypothetical protein
MIVSEHRMDAMAQGGFLPFDQIHGGEWVVVHSPHLQARVFQVMGYAPEGLGGILQQIDRGGGIPVEIPREVMEVIPMEAHQIRHKNGEEEDEGESAHAAS